MDGVDICRSYLQQVVTIHGEMFRRLLADSQQPLPLELAELFEDAANTYLDLSEAITGSHARGPPGEETQSSPRNPSEER